MQDIEEGAAVVDDTGLIGQVSRVYPWTSEVALISDREQVVPVQIVRNGLRAVLFGVGYDGALDLRPNARLNLGRVRLLRTSPDTLRNPLQPSSGRAKEMTITFIEPSDPRPVRSPTRQNSTKAQTTAP